MTPTTDSTLLIFSSEGQLYGLPAERVQSICKASALSRVPYLPEDFVGLFNYRGDLCLAIDFSLRMNRKRSQTAAEILIVLNAKESSNPPRGLLVHQVERIALASEIQSGSDIRVLDADTFINGGLSA